MDQSDDAPVILVIDDDELYAQATSYQLQTAGYRAEIALDAVTAMARIDGARPALILLDVNMPGVDGLDLCRYLKSTADRPQIPTLIVTGLPSSIARDRARQAGADAFLVKPVPAERLLEEVACRVPLAQPV